MLGKTKSPLKVALIGGTFNPPTKCHIEIGCGILSLSLADEVWYVPNDKHPFRGIQPKKAHVLSFDQRIDLLQASLENMSRDVRERMKICEVDRGTTNITKETISSLRRVYSHEFLWVLGTDCVNEWHKWANIDWLLENVTFIVFPRKDHVPDESKYWGILRERHHVLDGLIEPTGGSSTEARLNPDGGLLFHNVVTLWKSFNNI